MAKEQITVLPWYERQGWIDFAAHLRKHHQRAYMDDKAIECLNTDIDIIASLIEKITAE